jgi:predicted tellurium resistance membrane protein TerC
MAKQQQSITSLPRSPQDDRRSRMIQYSVAMTIRTVCLVLCLIVPDWWRLLPAIGAIVLPYIAVVLANASIAGPAAEVLRPGASGVRRTIAPGPDSR